MWPLPFAQRPFDPGFLVADDGSNDLVCEVTSSTLQLTPESALFSGLAEPALEKATEDHVKSKSLLNIFFKGSGPTMDTLRSRTVNVARPKTSGLSGVGGQKRNRAQLLIRMQNRRERLLLVLVPNHRAVRIAALVPHLPWAVRRSGAWFDRDNTKRGLHLHFLALKVPLVRWCSRNLLPHLRR